MAKPQRVASIPRQAIHHKAAEKKPVTLAKLRGKHHWHYCSQRDCRLIYSDACKNVGANGPCHIHRNAATRPLWVASRDPAECCIGNCFMVTDIDEIVRYQLAGPGPWFQCLTCARAHGWPCT